MDRTFLSTREHPPPLAVAHERSRSPVVADRRQAALVAAPGRGALGQEIERLAQDGVVAPPQPTGSSPFHPRQPLLGRLLRSRACGEQHGGDARRPGGVGLALADVVEVPYHVYIALGIGGGHKAVVGCIAVVDERTENAPRTPVSLSASRPRRGCTAIKVNRFVVRVCIPCLTRVPVFSASTTGSFRAPPSSRR
jgi:hypothetical protein